MPDRTLIVSFGGTHPAKIERARNITWQAFAKALVREPKVADDKAAFGWYCPAEFDPPYRDSDNFVARHAITFDFDHVEADTPEKVAAVWKTKAFALYTTYSHTVEKPRFRVVMPLSRPAGYDEFQAVARKIASQVGIELIARESFIPAQMMYVPSRRKDAVHASHLNEGDWIDVDATLAEYTDWTNVGEWPRRQERDGLHLVREPGISPIDKSGIVGEFCRAFRVPEAIARFELPYTPTSNPDRWTYTAGTRPEGAIIYDDGLKLHSHHDTDPARGQSNAFDLVRLHKFGHLDTAEEALKPITERASYRAMVQLAAECSEVQRISAAQDFEDLGPDAKSNETVGQRFVPIPAEEFSAGKPMEWIVRGVLPRAELCVIYGESGSGKSFLALDLCAAITRGTAWREHRTTGGRVVYVCAEGQGGFKARLKAYAQANGCQVQVLPAVVPDAPNLLQTKDTGALTRGILSWGYPDVVVIDTLSATTPGGNENSGEDMGKVLSHCKQIHKDTGALIVLIHHAGKDATKGARGWSGIKAAADAEIEVSRDGEMRVAVVTKMKDGNDGMRYPFRLNTVLLGVDTEGEPESSCSVTHLENKDEPGAQRRERPRGPMQVIMYDALKIVAAGGAVKLVELYEEAMKSMPKPEGRDERVRTCERALQALAAKKLAYLYGKKVSLTAVISPEGDWLS